MNKTEDIQGDTVTQGGEGGGGGGGGGGGYKRLDAWLIKVIDPN